MKADRGFGRTLAAGLVTLAVTHCGTTQVGSRFVKSQNVTALAGGTITVTAADSPELAGTQLVIPPGALVADTTLTLDLQRPSIVAAAGEAAGPVAVWGPPGTTFLKPATLSLPYTLATGQSAADLYVFVQEESGQTHTVEQPTLTVSAGLSTLPVSGFTRFQHGAHSHCPSGQTRCSGHCVNLADDSSNCGACGAVCAAGQSCSGGVCRPVGSDGGGACSPANCPGGCCQGNVCFVFPVQTDTFCGTGGAACMACPAGESCSDGACLTTGPDGGILCNAASCPNGCCQGGGCVPFSLESVNACGTGGAACMMCLAGDTCSAGACQPGGSDGGSACDPANCAGCCVGNVCYAGNSTNQCGTGGGACLACGAGQVCSGGACWTTGPDGGVICDSSDCAGCCSGNLCYPGTSSGACGASGAACAVCSGDAGQSCQAGTCI